MKTKMTMVYWKGEKFWLGKLLEYPEIMTQGETKQYLLVQAHSQAGALGTREKTYKKRSKM